MAENIKISELEKLAELTGDELIPVAKDGENYSITPEQIAEKVDLNIENGEGTDSLVQKASDSIKNNVTGMNTAAFGGNNTVTGNYGFAAGVGNTVGFVGFVAGNKNTVSGSFAAAVGDSNKVSGQASFAEGNGHEITSAYSHAEGSSNKVYALYGHAEGNTNTIEAGGQFGHVEGQGNTVSAMHGHAEGNRTVVSGQFGHAEGNGSQVLAMAGHAEGSAKVSNQGAVYAHAEGLSSEAKATASHAEGSFCIANGTNSHAEGNGTNANGYNSHAEGNATITNNVAEHAEGMYNASNNEQGKHFTISSIGIGSATQSGEITRKNAQEVMVNGDHYIFGIGGYDGTNPYESKSLQEVVNFGVKNESASGDVTIDPDKKVTVVNCEGDITNVILSELDSAYNADVIFTSEVERTVTIQRTDDANYVFPDGSDSIQLTVPAGGYAEANFLCDGNNHIFVRGI